MNRCLLFAAHLVTTRQLNLFQVAYEIHMPVDPIALNGKFVTAEKIPFAYDDERYVHHAWEQGQWFGRVASDAAGNTKIAYAETGHMVSLESVGPEVAG